MISRTNNSDLIINKTIFFEFRYFWRRIEMRKWNKNEIKNIKWNKECIEWKEKDELIKWWKLKLNDIFMIIVDIKSTVYERI